MSGGVDTSGATADPVYPTYVILDLNPAKGEANVMSGRSRAAETPDQHVQDVV